MAFLGEKLFAFLFLNGAARCPSAPVPVMKERPGRAATI